MNESISVNKLSNQNVNTTVRMTARQIMLIIILLGAQFMLAVDFSIVTVAIPKIGDELGLSLNNLQFLISAFVLPSAGFLLLFGRIGDIFGRKKLFLIGMALLTISSLIGGLASLFETILIARIVQGLATALVIPSGMSLITTSFEEGPLRTKALSLNGAILSLGFTSGAILGGILTDLLSWRWDFFINVPVGAVIFFGGIFFIKESVADVRLKLDTLGGITVTIGLLSFVLGITNSEHSGWSAPETWGSILFSAISFVIFYFVELRATNPLAPVQILKLNTVKWGNLGGLFVFSMESAIVFLLTLYLQGVLHLTPFQTGLMFGFLGLGCFLGGIFASKIIARIGSKAGLVWGLLIQGVTACSLFWLGENKVLAISAILIMTFIGGMGHVLAIVSYTVTATSGINNTEQGLAAGLATLTQQIGITVGTPIMSVIAASHYGGSTSELSILHGTTFGILIDGAIALGGAFLIATFLRTSRRTLTKSKNYGGTNQ
ncbi:MFS transporter [Paenibacillus sp. GCM10027628]|uniref:MFS transporter n=1 Tax=Paenibacillus sp. GCM10027628 TaxID=3273413 RepID=UPI003638A4FB